MARPTLEQEISHSTSRPGHPDKTSQHTRLHMRRAVSLTRFTFSPQVSRKSLKERLNGRDGSQVFKRQHRHNEVAGQRPGNANDAHHQSADQAHALLESAQNHAYCSGHKRPLRNRAFARPLMRR